MLTLSSRFVKRYQVLTILAITSAVWVLGTGAVSAARGENVTVRHIGPLDSVIADSILGQVNALPFPLQQASPMLLQGKTLSRLRPRHMQELKAAYQAGHTIVLLDATMEHIKALHGIIGEGVTYRANDEEGVLAYTLRHENHIPTATLVSQVQRSPLHPLSGDPDPTGLQDEALALNRAADFTVSELRHLPTVSVPEPRDPSQPADWLSSPLQTTKFLLNGPTGVYNTTVTAYALHSCDPDTKTGVLYDYYMVTTLADWTPTQAKFQSAATELGAESMYLAGEDPSLYYVVANWQDDPTLTYCSSHSAFSTNADICRYINYPLQYEVQMLPKSTATGIKGVSRQDAKPPGGQGRVVTYQSGFMFGLGGTVNVSGKGPQAGISAGVSWNNTSSTTVPAMEFDLGEPGNEGAMWTFKYCTGGDEPDPHTTCTNHVQTTNLHVCRGYFGDFTGTNPQQGQTPQGAFTDAVQTVLWAAGPDTRVGSTFDIEVSVTPIIGNTTANLWGAVQVPLSDGSPPGCNISNCDCVSRTTATPLPGASYTFQLPLPSTTCSP